MNAETKSNTIARPFVISRTFHAPREVVWKAHTEAERLKQWFTPKGFTMPRCTLDLKPGGVFHYRQETANGNGHWGKWVFREIAAPNRLVVELSFADADGNAVPSPFGGPWPLRILSAMTLDAQGDKTVLTVRWEPLDAADAERAAFNANHESMQAGWSATLDHLAAYLAG